MAKPTIFVFTTAYHPFIGGAEVAIQEVSRRLAGEFRFVIITARLRRDLPRRDERPEGAVIRVGFGSPADKWLLPFLGAIVYLRERSVVGTPLLWGMDISQGSLAAALVRLLTRRARLIFTIQYGYGGARLRGGRLGAIGAAFGWMLGRADAVTAISGYLTDEARRFGYRRPVKLLHNGVAFEAFLRPQSPPDKKFQPTVITVSRLVPKNGVDILIRALPIIQKSFPDIRCHILGSGPERSRLEGLAYSLGVAPAVTFFGDVPYADVPRHLAAADVFVRPARSEGMGNAFVEALASGLPVVGTPVEGILDIIADGRTGLFAEVDSPDDVAEKTIRLLRDRAFSQKIVEAGRAMVRERFSWDAIAAGYADVFRTAALARVLIATPMLPPDIGGPGAYAERLAAALSERGHGVSVLSYGSGAGGGRGGIAAVRVPLTTALPARLFRYALAAWRMLGRADVAIALDPVAVGGPLAAACRLRGKPFLLRLEGDALWERYVERTGEELTLRQFYETPPELSLSRRERVWQGMSRRVFRSARKIVFSSAWREAIFRVGYPMPAGRSAVIAPPWPNVVPGGERRNRALIFAGRFVRVKNIPRLVRAFAAATGREWTLELIGAGPEREIIEREIRASRAADRIRILPPLAPDELRRRIASAHAFVLPSLSDVSPNVILDCIASATPFLLTRETGFYGTLKDVGAFTDPLDGADITAKLKVFMDPRSYAALRERLAKFRGARSWETVAGEWVSLIQASL